MGCRRRGWALAAVLIALVTAGRGAAEPLKLVTGNGYTPYADADLPRGGLATALVREAFAAVGQPVTVAFRPWKRGYAATRARTYDATFPYVRTPERLAAVVYSEPIFTAVVRPWTLTNRDLAATAAADLKGLVGCLPDGYAPAAGTAALYANGTITRVSPHGMRRCFELLKRRRVDFVETNEVVGRRMAFKVFDDVGRVTTLKAVLARTTLHLIVSKRHPNARIIVRRFNTGLRRIRENGTHARVVRNYLTRP